MPDLAGKPTSLRASARLWTRLLIAVLTVVFAQAEWFGPAGPARWQALGAEALAGAPEPGQARMGRTVRINLPITSRTLDRVRQFVLRAVEKANADKQRLVLIFEFTVPADQAEYGRGSEFGAALSLAELLTSQQLSGVWTAAYVPQSIQGHAVLPVLACDEIIMAPKATIGRAGVDETVITESRRSNYREIADRRRSVPAAVALWMLDPRQAVYVVETEVSREFVTADQLAALHGRVAVKSERKLYDPERPELSAVEQEGLLSGEEARWLLPGVRYLADSRRDVAQALGVPEAVEEDLSLLGDWQPVRVDLKGPIGPDLASRVQRLIEQQLQLREPDKVSFICLWIDSPGGSLADSILLANYLGSLKPADRVRTVAYVPRQARADAALVALACHHLVMHPDAELGGSGAEAPSAEQVRYAREAVRDPRGPWHDRSWSLIVALIDPDWEVFRYVRPGRPDQFFSREEFEQYQRQHPNEADWRQGERITRPGRALLLDGRRAVEYRLAKEVVEDFAQFRQLYGLERDPHLVEPGWADYLIDVLASPGVSAFLLMVGFIALYVELHMPGLGAGGFLAAVCFVLFFWANYLGGTAGWLEAALFGMGVVCLLLEVVVLPGFGIFGLGGVLLIVASLILASQTFVVPRNPYQFERLQRSLLTLAGAGVGFVALAVVLRKWLPRAPVLRHVFLEPPRGPEAEAIGRRELLADFHQLLGTRGTAVTQLTPSGKARFGNRLVDVISEGELISRGSVVEVVEVRGNRVLVREVPG